MWGVLQERNQREEKGHGRKGKIAEEGRVIWVFCD